MYSSPGILLYYVMLQTGTQIGILDLVGLHKITDLSTCREDLYILQIMIAQV